VTFVDRATRCIVNCTVAWGVSDELLQALLDDTPEAHWYYSDELSAYQDLAFGFGIHFARPDKAETYSVEGDNAELRHYLARLARRSRCFSRCIDALRLAVRLFVYCWNQRQLYRQQYPDYPAHLIEFLSPCF
jgi:IS1 family transposase